MKLKNAFCETETYFAKKTLKKPARKDRKENPLRVLKKNKFLCQFFNGESFSLNKTSAIESQSCRFSQEARYSRPVSRKMRQALRPCKKRKQSKGAATQRRPDVTCCSLPTFASFVKQAKLTCGKNARHGQICKARLCLLLAIRDAAPTHFQRGPRVTHAS